MLVLNDFIVPIAGEISHMSELFKSKLQSLRTGNAFLKDSIMAMGLKLIGIGSSYLFIFLISKNFGAEGWGKFSLAISFIMFCILIGKFGFDLALLKFTSENEAKNLRSETKKIYFKGMSWSLSISLILTILIALNADVIASFLFRNKNMGEFIFYASLLIILHVGFLTHSEGLRGLKKNKIYLFLQYVGMYLLASIALLIFLPLGNHQDILPMQLIVFSSFILFAISTFLWFKELYSVKTTGLLSFPLNSIFKVSIPMMLSGAMVVFLNWTDTLLLGFYKVNEGEIGIYSVALKVAGIISLPRLAISAILAAGISENFTKGNLAELQNQVKNATRIMAFFSSIVFVLYLILPEFFLGIFGKDFTSGSSVLIILSLGLLIGAYSGCNDLILQMTGNEKLYQNIMIFATIINIGLNLILIPFLGIKGSAIASFCSVVFWNVISIYYIKKRLKINSAVIPL